VRLHCRSREKGQTMLEWLLLMAMVFITGYLLITGPVARFTKFLLLDLRSRVRNVIQNAEMTPGELSGPGEAGHPMDPARLKALHL